MPPKRRASLSHDQDSMSVDGDRISLKRSQIAMWRRITDVDPCEHEIDLDLALFKKDGSLIAQAALDHQAMDKRAEHYKANGVIDSYVITCPECGAWFAVGQKHE